MHKFDSDRSSDGVQVSAFIMFQDQSINCQAAEKRGREHSLQIRRESMWECEEMGRITITERVDGEEKGSPGSEMQAKCQ